MQDTPHLQPSYTTILHPINILVFSNIRFDWCRMTDDLSIQMHKRIRKQKILNISNAKSYSSISQVSVLNEETGMP